MLTCHTQHVGGWWKFGTLQARLQLSDVASRMDLQHPTLDSSKVSCV